jgi:hypothetical protein
MTDNITLLRELDKKRVLPHGLELPRHEDDGFAICNDKMKELISEYVWN